MAYALIQPPASRVETIYSKLRRSIELSRYNNCRLTDVLANPPTITPVAAIPGGHTNAFLVTGSKSGVFRHYGGTPLIVGNYVNMVSTTLPSSVTACQHRRHTTIVDDISFTYRIFGSTNKVRFIVDGQYVDLTGTTPNSSSGDQGITLDFTNVGGRKPRLVTLEWYSKAVGFGGIYCNPTGTCIQPPQLLRGVFLGDSYPADAGVDHPGDGLSAQIADFLGIEMQALGIGGTGPNNPGTSWKFGDHLFDIFNANPDLIYYGSSANDQFLYTPTQMTAAVAADIAAIRANAGTSTKPMFVFGSWSNQNGATTTNLAADAAAGAAVAAAQAAGDTNLFFKSVVANPNGPPITGTGNTSSLVGDGNCDVYGAIDGSHLNRDGSRYFAGWDADQTLTAIKDK